MNNAKCDFAPFVKASAVRWLCLILLTRIPESERLTLPQAGVQAQIVLPQRLPAANRTSAKILRIRECFNPHNIRYRHPSITTAIIN